jgi:hypothetical protein
MQVQDVIDMWPQLAQQCSPRFIAFLRDPGIDVTDHELLPVPPPPVQPASSAGSRADGDSDGDHSDDSATHSCCSEGSGALHPRDLQAGESEHPEEVSQSAAPPEHRPHHFCHSLTLLSREQRRVLLAAKCLMTRAGVASAVQHDVVYSCVEQMGKHVQVHTDCVELSSGKR